MVAFFFPPIPNSSGPNIIETDNRLAPDSISLGTYTFNSCSLGADAAVGETRLIGVLVSHGDTSSSPGSSVSCTVGGTSLTEYGFASTGNGSGKATGSVIFIGSRSGTSANIVVQWDNLLDISIVVLRISGYTTTGIASNGESSAPIGDHDGIQNYSITAGDALIGFGTAGGNNTPLVLSGITQRGEGAQSTTGGADNRKIWSWDTRMAANASLNIQLTPWTDGQGNNTLSSVRLHKI